MNTQQDDDTLHAALAKIGVYSVKKNDEQRRSLYRMADDSFIGSFTAAEAWKWLQREDYAVGFRHGSDSEPPDTRGIFDREAYVEGYIKGTEKRVERMAGGKGYVIIPEWMTPAQVEVVNKLYKRSPDGSADRWEFFTRIQECGIGSDGYAGITWCGMFVGIEKDGYTHT